MTDNEYTPTWPHVVQAYIRARTLYGDDEHRAERLAAAAFEADRWYAAEKAKWQAEALRDAAAGLERAMLGTTDGGLIDPDSDIPAGEMYRLAHEAVRAALREGLSTWDGDALVTNQHVDSLVEHLTPHLASEGQADRWLNEERARIWDEGYTATEGRAWHEREASNPYRS